MESQSQDFHVLARVKRKRKKGDQQVSSRIGSTHLGNDKSLGSFIQSALSEGGGGEEEGSLLVKGETGGFGTSRVGGGRSIKKGSLQARKKLKLGAREWVKLGAVKWPGFEVGEEDEDSAEIQVYSDSDLDLQEEMEEVLGFSDETQEFLEQVGLSSATARLVKEKESRQQLQQPVKRRWRRRCSGLRREWQVSTSTPYQQNEQVLTENIDDFESDTDASSTFSQSSSQSPLPSLHTFTPIATPNTTVHCKPSISKGVQQPPPPLKSFIGSTPEDLNIGTPPSSPEVSVSDLSKTKTSDWIKQIALESLESSRGCDMSNLHDTTTRTLYHGDSVKRSRGKKLVPGGLAEQLQRVVQREASEITFWEHKAKKLEEKDIDPSSCLTVHVLSLTNCYSLFIARCRMLSGSPIPQAHTCAVAVRICGTMRPSVEEASSTSDQTQQPSTAEQYFQSKEQDGAQCNWTTSRPPFVCGSTFQPCLNEMGRPTESGGSIIDTETHAGDPEPCSGVLTLEEVALRGLQSSLSSTAEMGATGRCGDRVKLDAATVLFSQHCAKFLNLRVGLHVRIHPPWQCLSLTPHSDTVILCTHFCQVVGYTLPPQSPTSPVPCKQKGIGGVYSLLSPEKTCLSNHSRLVKSPAKGLQPTRLFSDEAEFGHHPTVHSHETCDDTTGRNSVMPGPACMDSSSIMDVRDVSSRSVILGVGDRTLEGVTPCSLIEGLESARCGVVNFTGRVERIYRRKMAIRREYGEEGTRSVSMFQSFIQSARTRPSYTCRWVLLVRDSCGMYAELQVTASEENHSPWCDLIRSGEGKSLHFMNVRVIQRTTPSKNPELFSLISSLHLQSELPSKALASPQTSNMNDQDSCPSFVLPLFSYVLECQSDSQTLPYRDITPPSPTSPLATGLLHREEGTQLLSPSRVSLLARVVHIRLEVPQTDEDRWLPLSPPGPSCSYYLFVVTMAPSGKGQETVRVYLKSGFSIAGLRKVLTSPGTQLLLRDVYYETQNTVERHYSMDACSLVIPLCSASLGVDLLGHVSRKYWLVGNIKSPLKLHTRIFCSDELHTLSSLTTPHLPPLHPSTAAVRSLVQLIGCVKGVDEENAYSWPACDVCGSGNLSSVDDGTGSTNELYCDDCQRSVSSPTVHLQLAVFLHCPSLENHTVCVQLLQSTICKLLPSAVTGVEDGFDVHHVLDRELSLHACYIQEAKETAGRVIYFLEEVDVEFPE